MAGIIDRRMADNIGTQEQSQAMEGAMPASQLQAGEWNRIRTPVGLIDRLSGLNLNLMRDKNSSLDVQLQLQWNKDGRLDLGGGGITYRKVW